MSNAPTCRNCLYGVFPMSQSGTQIKRGAYGRCGKATELRLAAPRSVSPCYSLTAIPKVIMPTSKASKCPGFVHKESPCK